MKYQKPELVQLAPAIKAVQNPDNKNDPQKLDNYVPPQAGSIAAYAADE
jgi:hypothetical protein